MPWLEHLRSEMREPGHVTWEGREAVGRGESMESGKFPNYTVCPVATGRTHLVSSGSGTSPG